MTATRHQLPDSQKIAFKCPAAVTDEGFDFIFSTFYPETDIIIAIRHPVDFFRSFYNYRLRSKRPNGPVSFANELLGSKCHLPPTGVCTDAAKFALPLAKMGKTELGDSEVQLLSSMVYEDDPHYQKKQEAVTEYLTTMERRKVGRVFFYAMEQFVDEDSDRRRRFVEDLSDFIGLDHVMEKEVVVKESVGLEHRMREKESVKASHMDNSGASDGDLGNDRKLDSHEYYVELGGNPWDYEGQTEIVKEEAKARHIKMQIDICEPIYDKIRKLMVQEGHKTAQWIRDYFLDGEGVVVSQREHLEKILDTFSVDPCTKHEH